MNKINIMKTNYFSYFLPKFILFCFFAAICAFDAVHGCVKPRGEDKGDGPNVGGNCVLKKLLFGFLGVSVGGIDSVMDCARGGGGGREIIVDGVDDTIGCVMDRARRGGGGRFGIGLFLT